MLGILLGTDEGLLQLIPGEDPTSVLDAPVSALDYRDGVALAGAPGRGVWMHRGDGWDQVWEGEPRCVRVSPDGALYVGAEPGALFASNDGGKHWTELETLRRLLGHRRALPGQPAVQHAHVAAIVFPEGGVLAGVFGLGAWFTPDGGSTWLQRSEGLDPALHGMWEHPEQSARLFASTAHGFYYSRDAGHTWVQSLSGLDRSRAGSAAVLPGAPDVLVLALARREPDAAGALFRSANGGVSWSRLVLGDDDEWERAPLLWRLPESVDTLFAFADGAVWASHDTGRKWVRLADGLPPARALAAAL